MDNKSFKVVSDLSNVKDAEVLFKVEEVNNQPGDTIRFKTDDGRWVTFDFGL